MTQFIFFSGKGGVGKTSMACTQAVRYADEGQRTLIVTTDPASNLADVFEQAIGHQITPIEHVANLWAMEIDPDRATEEYIDRAMAPIRAAFPLPMVQVMEEQMSGPCTAEVAAFDRFTDFLDVPSDNGQAFDIVIFDTAPTGHTLRLLELPAEWSQSIDSASEGSGQTCIGPAAAIQDAKHKYERALAIMRDPAQTTFVFVLHPEAIAIKETQRAVMRTGQVGDSHAPIDREWSHSARGPGQSALCRTRHHADPLPPTDRNRTGTADASHGAVVRRDQGCRWAARSGSDVLRGCQRISRSANSDIAEQSAYHLQPLALAADVLARVSPNGHRRAVFFAGKGGVGKTVASCITAVWLARQGYKTLLLTTDPAAHIGDVLGKPVGDNAAPVEGVPNLWAAKIDPKAAAEVYKQRILDDARQRGRPEASIKVMAEELDSPCTEEMAAFDKFIDFASQADWQAIVFDTAPTGHTMRLIELPMDWSQQIDVKVFASVDTTAADDVAKRRFGDVIEMMRDPARSTFAFVMYPESTPILEAYRAAEELRTVGITAGLVVANFVIPAEQATTPFTQSRRAMQEKYLQEIAQRFAVPVVQVPLLAHEVKGIPMLIELGQQVYGPGASIEATPLLSSMITA